MTDYKPPRFELRLVPKAEITTPETVKSLSGHKEIHTYQVDTEVMIHFPNAHTVNESQRLLVLFQAEASGVTAGIWGGELVLSVPKAEFQNKFETAQPA